MNNLFGIFQRDGSPVDRVALDALANAAPFPHKPDVALWCENNVALGAQLQRTTPEARLETLPLIAPNHSLVLVAGARLDNRTELCDAFQISPPNAQ